MKRSIAFIGVLFLVGCGDQSTSNNQNLLRNNSIETAQQELSTTQSGIGKKVSVEEVVENKNANVTITTDSTYRYITSNGIPDHETGAFPNSGNPNTISTQSHAFRVVLSPVYTQEVTPAQRPGVALNGVFFEPGTAEAWNNDRSSGWNLEAIQDLRDLGLDFNNAHVQPTGAYHYHGIPTGVIDQNEQDLIVVGYAADGFNMYVATNEEYTSSWKLKSGTRPGNGVTGGPGGTYDGSYTQDFEYISGSGDLDECNGIEIDGTYAYIITQSFPYILRCLHGTPDASFAHGPGTSDDRPLPRR